MAGRAGQLVLGEGDLLLPGVGLIGRVRRRLAVLPVAALDGLAAAAPRRPALGVDDLALHVEAADEEVVALVLQELEDRARVLPHQDGVRRVVVDPELIADAVLLGDAVQRDPRPRRVGDVVVPVVAGGPAGHRALLDAIGQPARLRLLQQRHEVLLEVLEVLVHAAFLVAADEAADGVDAERRRRVERAQHEVDLLLADRRIVVQQVVEVADVGQADAGRVDRLADPRRALLRERLAQVERVGDRVEHRLGRNVRLGRMERRRQLDVTRAQRLGVGEPLLDRLVGIGVADVARGQLLQGGRQHAHLHELRIERLHRHQ